MTGQLDSDIYAVLPDEVIKDYDNTRPLPSPIIKLLFEPVFGSKHAQFNKRLRVLDVGSGTGRIAFALAEHFPALSIHGIDVWKPMVDYAKDMLGKRSTLKERLSFELADVLELTRRDDAIHSYDVVLCHWCFHCVRPWRAALLAALCLLKPGGQLVWLEEDSPLYRALDDLISKEDKDKVSKQWEEFWFTYHEDKSKRERRWRPHHRTGTNVRCTEELKGFLGRVGWTIDDTKPTYDWEQTYTYDWILDSCLTPQSFTNLRRISKTDHNEVISKLRSKVANFQRFSLANQVILKYTAKLLIAVRTSSTLDPGKAGQYVEECARDIQRDIIFLCGRARTNEHAMSVLLNVIRVFFIALFRPLSLPYWNAFWGRDKNNSCLPRWAWVRLATKKEELDTFLREPLWSYPEQDQRVLTTYFESGHTFAGLIGSSSRDRRPVAVLIDDQVSQDKVAVCVENHGIAIRVSKGFVDGYSPQLPDSRGFDPGEWKAECANHLETLIKQRGGEEKRIMPRLLEVCRDVDTRLGMSAFGGSQREFVSFLHAVRLFPGNCYYLFPLKNLQEDLASSVTFGTDLPLSDAQIERLDACCELVLTVPTIVTSMGS